MCIVALTFMANSNNPPNGRTGAPGDLQCSGCHQGGGGGFDGTISLSGVPSNAVPNQTYNLTLDVDVTMGNPMRAGFQLVALFDSDDSNAGVLSNPGSSSTIMNVSSTGRDYWEHNPALVFGGGSTVTWDVEWTAPNATDGITFYMSSILGNGSGSGGDRYLEEQEQTSVVGTNPIQITFLEFSDPFCADGEGSFVIASPSGGTSPYTFLWSNGSTDDFLENVPAGTYTVTVTDDIMDTGEASVTFAPADALEADPIITNITCNGFEDGEVDLNPQNGNGAVLCLWDDGFDECFRDGLSPGNYNVTLSDATNCLALADFDIEEPEFLDVAMSASNATIAGNDGTATAEGLGGTSPYSFQWSNGVTENGESSTITGLSPGVYDVLVVDSNGCQIEGTVSVGGVGCNLNVSAQVSNISCAGASDGNISLTNVGGGSLTYLWSNGATTASIDSLNAGMYSVDISDSTCDTTLQMMISEPDSLSATLIILSKPSCANTTNGRLGLALAGGDGDYTLSWSSGQTNDTMIMGLDTLINIPDTLLNLSTGMYVYELEDGNGCTFIDSVFLDNGDNLQPFIMVNNSFTIELDANGTAPALTFADIDEGSFDNCGIDTVSFSTPTFDCSNIGTNIYPVTITDTNNNSVTENVEVVIVEFVAPDIDCSGSNISTNSCEAVFYTLPTATDNCGNPTVELTSGLASGSLFPAGINTVTYMATDECGNSAECSFTVTVSNDLVATIANIQNAGCNSPTGSVEIAVTGGTPPYSVAPFGSLMQSGLAPGNYSVDVSDAAGCITTISFAIEDEDSDLEVDLLITDVTCAGESDGMVEVIILSGGSNSNTIDFGGLDPNNLGPGSYEVLVTDDFGCSVTVPYDISEPAPLTTEIINTGFDPCTGLFNENDLEYDVMGGISPYTLSSVALIFDGSDTTNIEAVEVIIEDNNGCDTQVFVEAPDVSPIQITSAEIVNQTDIDGSIDIEVTGGNGELTYQWFDEVGNTVGTEQDVVVGTGFYMVVITDANGCESTETYFVDIESSVVELDKDNLFIDVFPNPAVDLLKVEFKLTVAQVVSVYDTHGQLIMKTSDINQTMEIDLSHFSSGLYILKLDFEEKVIVKNFIKK